MLERLTNFGQNVGHTLPASIQEKLPISKEPSIEGISFVVDASTLSSQDIGNLAQSVHININIVPPTMLSVLVNGTENRRVDLPLSSMVAVRLLSNIVFSGPHYPIEPINIDVSSADTDPRSKERKALESIISKSAPFDLQGAKDEVINPSGKDSPELAELMKRTLYGEVIRQAKKLKNAEAKKAELSATNPEAAVKILTVDDEVSKLPEDVALSLRALAMGDRERLMQLVSEYRALEKIREERQRVLRGLGEYYLLRTQGVPKSIFVISHLKNVPEDLGKVLSEKERRQARNQYSPQFADASERLAAATVLANKSLKAIGERAFNTELLTKAQVQHEHALEPQQAEQQGFIVGDYSSIVLENGQLVDRTIETGIDMPFAKWQELPIVPLLMKSKEFRQINPQKEDPTKTIAHNIMVALESGQVSNHGAHVAISKEARERMLRQIEKAVSEDKPVQLELYYTLARMSNPLEGTRKVPGLQEWAMLYKFAQVAETVKLFYQPANGQPPLQWAIIDEGQVFQEIWDLDTQETARFRNDLLKMANAMGLSQTILFDDLRRMLKEGGEGTEDLIRRNYSRIENNWQDFERSGLSLDDYLQPIKDQIGILQNPPDGLSITDQQKLQELREVVSDVQTIHDRHISMLRLINPLKHHPNMTFKDLLAVYNNDMPHIDLGNIQLSEEQKVIRADIERRALHANIYSKAVMDARPAMKRRYPDAVQVTITDKQDKIVVFTGDDRTQVFPGHGEATLMYSRRSSFGSPEQGKDWINVCRSIEVLADKIVSQENGTLSHRYVGVIDPQNSSGTPYYYIETPVLASDNK